MQPPSVLDNDVLGSKKRPLRSAYEKRAHSTSPVAQKHRSQLRKPVIEVKKRCQSLSPSTRNSKISIDQHHLTQESASTPETINLINYLDESQDQDKDLVLPQCLMSKLLRSLAAKKKEFVTLRKCLISQQNTFLEQFALLRELESRAGVKDDGSVGEVRLLSVSSWPAHDLLLLIRDDLEKSMNSEINGQLAPQVLRQLNAQLSPLPEVVLGMGDEIMARRIDLLTILRGKNRTDRLSTLSNSECKRKDAEMDHETERLNRLVAITAKNIKTKIKFSLDLAKVPWLDRESMIKTIDRLQKENMLLQYKIDDMIKKENDESKEHAQFLEKTPSYHVLCDELSKERAAREALKEVVSSAESMLRVARARIATLERQLKDMRSEVEAAKRKQKELEQLYRHRETSYDARSRKLLEVSKTGEVTIESLSRQRDALELRVKELREQAEAGELAAKAKEAELRARAESLQAKVAEKEKSKQSAVVRTAELEDHVKELEEQLQDLREKSVRLVDMDRRRCLEYVPSKENEPSDRETEIWKELQVTRVALARAEEELCQCRADKDSFLNSLSRIAQGEGADSLQDKMATELLDREQKIAKLQHIINDQNENEKIMEKSMTQYENQLAALRLEVKRLRNYDCYAKEIPFQELQTELLELHMQVETLSRERTALVTAAASRALMLERHERAADLFARMIRARHDLAAMLELRAKPPPMDETTHAEMSRSLSSMCASSADTWTALRVERARVLRLESAVLAQTLQLEREGRVRTQLERRRAMLERVVLRAQHAHNGSSTFGSEHF